MINAIKEGNLELIQLMVSQNVPSIFPLFKNECGLTKNNTIRVLPIPRD